MSQSIFVRMALGLLRDAISEVVNVENVDAALDGMIDTAKEAGASILGKHFPAVKEPFEAICDKAKEGTVVAELVVDAVNEMLSFSATGSEVAAYAFSPGSYSGELQPVALELSNLRSACCGFSDATV